MARLLRPPRLQRGDTIASISLSSGLAARFPHRYEAGKRQLEETFGLKVIETPHALCDDAWLYRNPEARADDLHWALEQANIKRIVSIIGGDNSVRVLPFVDLELIRQRPKVFLGFSDSIATHLAFHRAEVVSFYGPALLTDFAENGGILPYTVQTVTQALFEPFPFPLEPAPIWTEAFCDWAEPTNQDRARLFTPNPGWLWLQGGARAEGRLLGGCAEVLEMLKGTRWWPGLADWQGAVLYLETSEETPPPTFVTYWLRNYAAQGILGKLNALLLARPMNYSAAMTEELHMGVLKVLAESGREDLPVVAGMDIGHTSPMAVLPNGCRVAVDPIKRTVEVLEGVVA